ncbi:hypothetical protein E4U45_007612 [Claviceps purpurea]|nr:hypothetical protein E4U45_007612 [Claviceps purpurea]
MSMKNTGGGYKVKCFHTDNATEHLVEKFRSFVAGFKTDLVRVVVQEIAESVYIEDSS